MPTLTLEKKPTIFFLLLAACLLLPLPHAAQAKEKTAITENAWQEAVLSVGDLPRTAAFFTDIGGYDVLWKGKAGAGEMAFYDLPSTAHADVWLLGHKNFPTGQVRLVKFHGAGKQAPMRPGGHAWDSGCYFSLMVRMKNIRRIYDQAIDLGWWTETPITPLKFGTSDLRVVIFKGPHGIQVQGYERLSPPLPDAIPEFSSMSAPFNIMQMVSDRDRAYDFFKSVLGFETFHHGKPHTSAKPEPMPIGIPANITNTSRYAASIVYPVPGEFGRMEMIETMDLKGYDFSDRCAAPNYGILSVRFPVGDIAQVRKRLSERGAASLKQPRKMTVQGLGAVKAFAVHTPDGARIEFYQPRPGNE